MDFDLYDSQKCKQNKWYWYIIHYSCFIFHVHYKWKKSKKDKHKFNEIDNDLEFCHSKACQVFLFFYFIPCDPSGLRALIPNRNILWNKKIMEKLNFQNENRKDNNNRITISLKYIFQFQFVSWFSIRFDSIA